MNDAPKFRQIEDWLRSECVRLGTGGVLPSETEVADRFQASRMTARRAFNILAGDGLIERRRRVGSIVLPRPLHREEAVLHSFTDEMRRRGMTASSRVLSAQVGVDPEAAARLTLDPSAWVVTIRRVRCGDGTPLALETTALPGEYAAVLDADLEHGSLHAALAALGRRMVRATGFVTARLADPDEARLLDLTPPAALLMETRLINDAEGRHVESTQTAYAGGRWVLDTGAFVQGPDNDISGS